MNAQRIIQIGHNYFEQHDKDTIKQLCVNCGGKGFYLLMQGFPNASRNPRAKGEIQPCTDCEDGYKYSKMIKEYHGGG